MPENKANDANERSVKQIVSSAPRGPGALGRKYAHGHTPSEAERVRTRSTVRLLREAHARIAAVSAAEGITRSDLVERWALSLTLPDPDRMLVCPGCNVNVRRASTMRPSIHHIALWCETCEPNKPPDPTPEKS